MSLTCKRLIFLELVNEDSELVVKNQGNKVNNLEDEVGAGDESNDTNDKGNGVLGLGPLDDSVNATDNPTKENLKNNSCDFGEVVILLGNRRGCHFAILLL